MGHHHNQHQVQNLQHPMSILSTIQLNTINSTSPSYPNYPSTVGHLPMSEFYNYDHDFVAPATPNGINMSTFI